MRKVQLAALLQPNPFHIGSFLGRARKGIGREDKGIRTVVSERYFKYVPSTLPGCLLTYTTSRNPIFRDRYTQQPFGRIPHPTSDETLQTKRKVSESREPKAKGQNTESTVLGNSHVFACAPGSALLKRNISNEKRSGRLLAGCWLARCYQIEHHFPIQDCAKTWLMKTTSVYDLSISWPRCAGPQR